MFWKEHFLEWPQVCNPRRIRLQFRSRSVVLATLVVFVTLFQVKRLKYDATDLIQPFAQQAQGINPRYAFATVLLDPVSDSPDAIELHNHYFVATRILCYQLLHCPELRAKRPSQFLVLVTEGVPQKERDRLGKDGATVIAVEYLREGWVVPTLGKWRDVLVKLRLWQLVQYDKIAFMDADTVLTQPLDGVFEDKAAMIVPTLNRSDAIMPDEATLPQSYVLAGTAQLAGIHGFPPSKENHDFPNIDYLNAGFFVLSPSHELFAYYESLLRLRGRFDPGMPEQNLLNYAHRREGNMPWRQLDVSWNIQGPTMVDVEGGAISLHDKWWGLTELREIFLGWRWRMEGFFEASDMID